MQIKIAGVSIGERITMGNVIDIQKYLKHCINCKWHDAPGGAYIRPGGYRMDVKAYHRFICLDFARKVAQAEEETKRKIKSTRNAL